MKYQARIPVTVGIHSIHRQNAIKIIKHAKSKQVQRLQ